ncbi:MAG: PhzF family phenazine biosynthesis protein [Alphaproteobacteria bacterium]|jgi:PhzF family phenazine biosynthesis protein|nr:PhzF family phenazine biosynthesis protein [Alphaproteobacteria bacterium]
MKQPIFQINAFASGPFAGNPAAVCPLSEWLDDALMQRIAAESKLTCAFFVGGAGRYRLRWFTPTTEIDGICGHGTLAAAFVIDNELGDDSEELRFDVEAGELRVRRRDHCYVLDLPALVPKPFDLPTALNAAFGRAPNEVLGATDLIAVLATEADVAGFEPDLATLARLPLRAAIVTAPGADVDFVSRWFAPKQGEGEDTGFTGSAHCSLVPYWAERLGKTHLVARQLSPRGATVACEQHGDRVWLLCSAVKYMQGHLCL